MSDTVNVGDQQSPSIFQQVQTTLDEGLKVGDGVTNSIFQQISTTLSEAIGVSDSPLHAIFQTVTATVTETVSVTDGAAHNLFHTITATISEGLSAADELFAPPAVPVTSLAIEAHSPVNILIVTPTGAQAGFTADGTSINQLGANLTGPGTEPESVAIPTPSVGNYVVVISGTSSASQTGSPYTITVDSLGTGGTSISQWSYTGSASPGSTGALSVYLLSNGKVTSSQPAPSTAKADVLYVILVLGAVGALAVLLVSRRASTRAGAPQGQR